ncbi:MAG: sigma-70 family RNA polymerase sigma factor [Planctomycetota bacterium]
MSDDKARIDVTTLLSQQEWMRSLAFQMVFDDHQADDIVQDAAVAALRSERSEVESPRAWLSTVMRNLARRGHRSRSRRDSRERRAARPELQVDEDVVERAELHGLVTNEVLALEEPYRSTVLLRFFDGLKPSEIAERLDVPAATVRVRLRRALDRLRGRMDEAHGQSRSAWCLLFASAFRLPAPPTLTGGGLQPGTRPAASSAMPSGTVVSTLGGFIVTSKKLTAVVVIGILIAGFSYVALQGGEDESSRPALESASSDHVFDHEPPKLVSQGGKQTGEEAPASVTPELGAQGPRLAVRVLRGDTEEPIANVVVLLTASDDEIVRVITDSSGEVTARVPFGRYRVTVDHPTLALAAPATCLHEAGRDPYTLRLYAGGALVGHVLDRATREPVANAVVRAAAQGALNSREVVSDGNGAFRLDGLSVAPLSSEITWRATGYLAPPRVNPNRVRVASAEVREGYVLLIDRGAVLRGRVVNEAGEPVGGAAVHLLARRTSGSQSVTANAAGQYELAVPPGQYHVRATSGTAVLVAGPFDIDWSGWDRDLTLSAGARVSGVLVEDSGAVMAGKRVVFRSQVTGELDAEVPTDSSGRFVAEGLAPGSYDVFGGYGNSNHTVAAESITVREGEQLEGVAIVLSLNRELAIRGRVLDGYGAAAKQEFLWLTHGRESHYGRSDANGEFEFFGLRDVEYTIAWGKERRTVLAGTNDVLLQEPGAVVKQRVTVRVLDASGAPVYLFGVKIQRPHSRSDGFDAVDHDDPEVQLTRSLDERVEVAVQAPDVGTGKIVLEPEPGGFAQKVVELRLQPVRRMTARVIDEQGQPIASAMIYDGPISGDDTRILGRSLEDGTVVFDGSDLREVFVQHPDYAPAVRQLETDRHGESVSLQLVRGVMIDGRIHRDGNPLRTTLTVDCPHVGQLRLTPDAEGHFTVRVPTGPIRVSTSVQVGSGLDGTRRLSKLVTAEGRETLEVDLDIPPFDSALSVTVRKGARPVAGATVTVQVQLAAELTLSHTGVANDRGEFLLEHLPAGDVSVQAIDRTDTQSARAAVGGAILASGRTTTVALSAEDAVTGDALVRGRVLTLRGGETGIVMLVSGEVKANQVGLQALQQWQMSGAAASRVEATGWYRIPEVAAGQYTLVALAIAGNIGTPQEFAKKTRLALSPLSIEDGSEMTVDLELQDD